MNMRQKLLPIFIAEAEKNLKLLTHCLSQDKQELGDPEILDSAYRAAHTIKGTAKLVEAESIHRITGRLEALLEKHAAEKTNPSPVEYEAMRLTIDWAYQLIDGLKNKQPQAKALVDEALHALDLAERFPGASCLTDLLDATPTVDSAHDDPFADDPEIDLLESTAQKTEDPFAEDPDFGIGPETDREFFCAPTENGDMLNAAVTGGAEAGRDSPGLTKFDSVVTDFLATAPPISTEDSAEEIFDPFAGDPDISGDAMDEDSGLADAFAPADEENSSPEPVQAEESKTQAEALAPSEPADFSSSVTTDPFADDPDDPAMQADLSDLQPTFNPQANVEPVRQETNGTWVAEGQQAELNIADDLLLGSEERTAQPEYVACNFSYAGHDYSLPIDQMREIAELPALLPLPLAPPLVSGLVNLRGRVMPVINLADLNPGSPSGGGTRRLVVGEYHNEQVAFLAEGVPLLGTEETGEVIDLAEFLEKHRVSGVLE